MISYLWVLFLVCSLVFGLLTGRMDQVTAAATQGAANAVELCVSLLGVMCLWSGLMEVMSASGLAGILSRALQPILRPLFGRAARDPAAMEAVSANVTANLLGLGNAATPLGLRAADLLHRRCRTERQPIPDEVLTLMVINTASIQLIPTTVAAVRQSLGAPAPYSILPAVWCASLCSVAVAVAASRLLRRFW